MNPRHHRGTQPVLLLLLALIQGGCVNRISQKDVSPAFVVRRLQLQQRDASGKPLWDLQSPEARYDITGRQAQAIRLSGTLFVQGQPRYRITAGRGVVIDDGVEIRLEQGARIATIEAMPIEVTARRMRWWPARKLLELEGNPSGKQGGTRLSSNQARFLLDQQKLELQGTPTLEHWRPNAGRHREPGRSSDLRLQLSNRLEWFVASGALQAPGLVRGEQGQPGGPLQTLQASGLSGNSQQRRLELSGPIRMISQPQGATRRQSRAGLHSPPNGSPTWKFAARPAELEILGNALWVDLQAATLWIPAGCQVRQPQQHLTAQNCTWSWRDQSFNATGNVVLQRLQNNQITRSNRLDGKLGQHGWLVFSNPHGRVESQLRLDPQPQRSKRPGSAIAL